MGQVSREKETGYSQRKHFRVLLIHKTPSENIGRGLGVFHRIFV